ncbi:MAG: hypothetical protein KDA51_02995 [Planctomycetales bacterium]|nr:hypothetical protein [Planctomycetales bacterium]
MKLNRFALPALAMATLGLPLFVGCGGSSTGNSPTAQQSSTSSGQVASSATVVAEGAETEPAQTVAIFLDSLRKGDEQAANGVLTAIARQELAKTAYNIQPLGTPAGQYQIGRVGFPYPEKNIALVECTWTEPATDDTPAEVMEIVCEVHQDAEGWRISGIGLTIPGTEQPLVLDFENAASLQSTIDAVTGQTSPPTATQIAGDQSASTPTLPQFPSAPNANATAPGLPEYPQQIASPQFDNAPINR